MSNIFDLTTDELSITGYPEAMEIVWDDPLYVVIRPVRPDLICARFNLKTNEVEFDDEIVSFMKFTKVQTDEMKRRLIKYKDRIIEMHLKHEHLHVPVRRAE